MEKFTVTIKATVTKKYIVDAETEEDAINDANECFSVLCDDVEEYYDQDTIAVNEL